MQTWPAQHTEQSIRTNPETHANDELRIAMPFVRANFITLVFVFLLTFLLLFLGMSRIPNIYDESLVLVGAMRTAAGQVVHRDFYANYGPAQFYIEAGLFKLFGPSLLVERLFDLLLKSLLLTGIYAMLRQYCGKAIADGASILVLVWLFALNGLAGTAVIAVSVINLAEAALLLPLFTAAPSKGRMLALGALSGLAALFRYDSGTALLGISACAIAIAAWMRCRDFSATVRATLADFVPCLAGFLVVFLPAALLYLAHAPFSDFKYDILTYPLRYYKRSRNLPFPPITLKHSDELADYLPIPIVIIALYVLAVARRQTASARVDDDPALRARRGFLVVFALLTFVFYMKGLVRISPSQFYMCIVSSIPLLALLLESRRLMRGPLRTAVVCIAGLYTLAAVRAAHVETKWLHSLHSSMPEYFLRVVEKRLPGEEAAWCQTPGTFTRGFCFKLDPDRMRTVDYIRKHTTPNQFLFVGAGRHDKIFANDLSIYFAANRMPATKWAHFDPNMQNTLDIQTMMVGEIDRAAPPVIVLDSEFDTTNEPNDSSKSTGVTLLDDYIRRKYHLVETHGTFSILQRLS